MLIQEMRPHAAGNDAVVVEEMQAEKKMIFTTFSRMKSQIHRAM